MNVKKLAKAGCAGV